MTTYQVIRRPLVTEKQPAEVIVGADGFTR